MSVNRWQQVEEIFHGALDLAPDARSAFLDRACGGDDALRREVESLLAHEREEGSTFVAPEPEQTAESRPGASLSAGDRLGPYEISELIGAGGMGEVYRARDPRLRRNVALKVLPADVSQHPSRRKRFEREAHAVAALNHPNIVAIYDVGEDRGVYFIVTELVDGEPLRPGRLSPRRALDIATQIASGLAAAHQAGVVHRDLKPPNILLDREGRVKILDFGLAKLAPETLQRTAAMADTATMRTHPGLIMGTPGYMSPEQVKGEPADHRSDIFSFGLILYELLAGNRAFPGSTMEAMSAIVNSDPPELPESVPLGLRQIVTHCLEKDSARRFQSARDLSFALSALSQATGTSIALETPRRVFRWQLVAAIAAGCTLLIAGSFVASRWLWRDSPPHFQDRVVTSFVGVQGMPSISPDGNQFAFSWDGDIPNGKRHVYIGLVGKGTPLRLTPENEVASRPLWSPDGQSIAYWRAPTESEKPGVFVMQALGGPGRRVNTAPTALSSWSPDGKWLLWGQGSSIYAVPSAGGEIRTVLDSPQGVDASFPAVSPDGRELVWLRNATWDFDLYVASFDNGRVTGAPRQITHDHRVKYSPLWINGGKEILYFGGDDVASHWLYRVRSSGGETQRIEGIGENASGISYSEKTHRLLYSTVATNYDIYRVDLTAPDRKPERFLSSSRFEESPTYSPDGKRIAFSSNRGGDRQIWFADADGANLMPLTSFTNSVVGSPKWSPDGQSIIFDARPDGPAHLYTVPAGGGPVKQLTRDPVNDAAPGWSPDGKWIYFTSMRAGPYEIFRMRPDGAAMQQMTHNGGYYAMVSKDGKWLYYASPYKKELWKMPADGGTPTLVLTEDSLYGPWAFVVNAQGLYAIGPRGPEGFPAVLYPLDGGKPRPLFNLPRAPRIYPEVSPDGRWFLYTSADDPRFGIMLVENFR